MVEVKVRDSEIKILKHQTDVYINAKGEKTIGVHMVIRIL